MQEPSNFFSDPIERLLADEAWKVGANTDRDQFFTWYPPHEAMKAIVETPFQKQVITARNWITAIRDQDSPWGNNGVERAKGYLRDVHKRDFDVRNSQIANVEHFYTSALMVAISGTFFVALQAGTMIYEVILQPVAVGIGNLSLGAAWNNLKNNWKQLTGPDKDGVIFMLRNSNYNSLDIQQFLSVDPEVLPPGAPVPKPPPPAAPPPLPASGKSVTIKPGQSLSVLARELYRNVELWPLIWDLNKAAFPNPNRVKAGSVLKYKELHEYSQAEIQDAKRRSPTWRNFPM